MVEVLAVVVILGILAIVAVPSVYRYVTQSEEQSYDTMAKSARQATESYLLDHSSNSGTLRIKNLIEDEYLERTVDPNDNSKICDGYVIYKLVPGDEDTLDEYEYTVNLCCINYEKAYMFPSGEKKDITQDKYCDALNSVYEDTGELSDVPTCNLKLSGTGKDSNYSSDVTVKMETTGVILEKGLDVTPNSTNGKTSVKHTIDGENITYYGYVKNELGEATCEVTFTKDTVAPVCPTITTNAEPETWTKSNVSFDFDFSDDIVSYDWYTNWEDDSGWKPKHGNYYSSHSSTGISGEGKRTVKLVVYDAAGNTTECLNDNKYYYIDRTSPTTPVLTNDYVDKWSNKSFPIKAKSSDAESGIAYYQYCYPGVDNVCEDVDWVTYNNSSRAPGDSTEFTTTNFSKERNEYVAIRACDYSGNCSGEAKTMIRIDKTAPTISELKFDSSTRTLTANISDSDSLVSYYTVTTSSTKPSNFTDVTNTSSYKVSYKASNLGATYYVWGKDEAGNVVGGADSSISVPATAYSVSYDANGGSGAPAAQTKYYGTNLTLSSTIPTRPGYLFDGWSTSKNATSATYPSGGTYTSNSSVTLHAVWKENIVAYAIYSADDNSLRFYKNNAVVTVGSKYNGRTVTALYTGVENSNFLSAGVPWSSYAGSITSVVVEEEVAPTSTGFWFYGFSSCSNFDLTKLNTTNVTSMISMFERAGYDASSLTITGLNKWNTAKVKTMGNMFFKTGYNVQSFKLTGLGGWNTSSVIDMSGMFSGAGYNSNTWSIDGLDGWNVSKVESMKFMFSETAYNASSFDIGNLEDWITSEVTTMQGMFYLSGYNNATTWHIGELDEWNTSKVTNMAAMFAGTGFKSTTWSIGDLSEWDTSSVTTMANMFDCAGYATKTSWSVGDLDDWDVLKVEDLSYMFHNSGANAASWNIGKLNQWVVYSSKNMSYMFAAAGRHATTFNIGDIGGWDTFNAYNMSNMFNLAGENATTWYVGDLSRWNTSNVTNMDTMFAHAGKNATYSLNLSGWNVSNVNSYGNFKDSVESKIIAPSKFAS